MHVQGTRFNLIAAKLRCSHGTLSLIAKMKKSTCTNIFKSSYIYSVQRYDFVSEVGKIVTKKKYFFINERNWSSG